MKLFDKLTTVPTRLQKALQVKQNLVQMSDELAPIGLSPVALAYKHELHIVSQFWIDKSEPNQSDLMHHQLRISKELIIRYLYGDVLDQLLPIRRAIANRDLPEASKLVDDLQKSILDF